MTDFDRFKSEEEVAFAHWCIEAADALIIQGWQYEPITYPLLSQIEHHVDKVTEYKRKPNKTVRTWKTLLQAHEYTPDFIIVPGGRFEDLKHGLIHYRNPYYHNDRKPKYVIDVKGTFQRFDGARSFSINQKWVFDKHGVYVNKVVPQKFFKKTWVPAAVAFGKNGGRLKRYEDCRLLEDIL